MSHYDLIIFDCDGVLVDSERITNQIFLEMLNDLGLALTLEDLFEQFVGASMAQCIEISSGLLGGPLPDHFVNTYVSRTKAALESELKPVPGVSDALSRISVPYCVASSGDHQKIRTTLGTTGLWKHFEGRIFSVTEVANPKPAPDVFLYAAAKCGANPLHCVVVEDTPSGVKAAVAAGMSVLGYSGSTPAHRLLSAGAHRTFDCMSLLPGLVEQARICV